MALDGSQVERGLLFTLLSDRFSAFERYGVGTPRLSIDFNARYARYL